MNTKLPREPISRPGEPTDAAPGSARKIRVLMERAGRREALFHPQDNLKRRLSLPTELAEVLAESEVEEALEADLAG